jgi:hypothetical protein
MFKDRYWSLFWTTWIQSTYQSSFSNIHSNIIRHLPLGFPSASSLQVFGLKTLYLFLISPVRTKLILLDLITIIIFYEDENLSSSSLFRYWGCSVSHRLDNSGSSLGKSGIFSLRYRVQTSSRAHPALYPMGAGVSFPRGMKLTTHLNLAPMFRVLGTILPLPHTSSWRDV